MVKCDNSFKICGCSDLMGYWTRKQMAMGTKSSESEDRLLGLIHVTCRIYVHVYGDLKPKNQAKLVGYFVQGI